jgi:drug/metabolite transporter (DMT)-like permease
MLAFWRSAFAALVLLPAIRRPCFRVQMLPMMTCFAIMVWSFMSAMVYGPAANAIWLQYLAPAWVLVGSSVFLRQTLSNQDLCLVSLCVAGVLLILLMEMRQQANIYASAMGLLSGVSFAGVVVSMKSLRGVDPAWLITLNHSATAFILLPWVWNVQGSVSAGSYVALGLFGVFQMSLPYVLFARGLRSVTSPEASVISLLEPILVPLWVFIAWRHHEQYDPPKWWTILGGSIILTALLLRYVPALVRNVSERRSHAG